MFVNFQIVCYVHIKFIYFFVDKDIIIAAMRQDGGWGSLYTFPIIYSFTFNISWAFNSVKNVYLKLFGQK